MLLHQENITLNWATFDAVLNTAPVDAYTNAQLTIGLKVCLRQNGGAPRIMRMPQMTGSTRLSSAGSVRDADRHSFVFDRFDPAVWTRFTSFYQSEGQLFWDSKFWLTMPDDFDASSWLPESQRPHQSVASRHSATIAPHRELRPAIDCHFTLQLVENPTTAHTTIDVYNIVRNFTSVPGTPGATYQFRSHSTSYDASVLQSVEHRRIDDETSTPISTSQRTFIHELGHSIGLEHVGVNMHIEGCVNTDDHNSIICYGNTFQTFQNVMGAGEGLTWHEALPWRRAMEVLTGVSRHAWHVHQSPVRPQSVLRTG